MVFEGDASIAICGANFNPQLDHRPPNGDCDQSQKRQHSHTWTMPTGSVATLPRRKVAASVHTQSSATQINANYGGKLINAGDVIALAPAPYLHTATTTPPLYVPHYSGNYLIRIVASVETPIFSAEKQG